MAKRKTLKKTFPLLKLLSKLSAEQRTLLLEFLNDEAQVSIKNCIKNALYNCDIQEAAKKSLKTQLLPHKTVLHSIVGKRGGKRDGKITKKDKQQIQQVGGALGAILAAVLPLLASVLFHK